ncbi:PspC domain-containing protein [Methylococcus geothermalis]|uniref:PspC domain-containing protein n=1 Tax=Methylococcus geothermalis TaxID=2681310 RepID=A0A858Q875_9GAMM|nr:PspC domain-containing protein [Methylococcus geothermalis]QJD30068.1 PspC domain-containing protein [Methylococcus geothermalis]
MQTPPSLSRPSRLERDLDRRRIGGVCAGIARYFGLEVSLVRLIFLVSIFFSFSFTFWLYLVLWLVLPARGTELSWRLRRKARRLARLFDGARARARHPALQAKLSDTEALVQSLLPQLDLPRSRQPQALIAVRKAALEELPALLSHYLELPEHDAASHRLDDGRTPEQQLVAELDTLGQSLRQVALETYSERFARTAGNLDELRERFDGDPVAAVRVRLETLRNRVAGRVDPEAEARIASIAESLLGALDRLLRTAHESDPMLYDVRRIALEYLPDAVEHYLALPADLARSEPLLHGKTAQAVLHEQLDVLDQSLRQMLHGLYRDDAQAMAVHARFLKEKFARSPAEWSA